MSKVKVAVVGCGAVAEGQHLPGIRAIEGMGKCELVAVCDVAEERVRHIQDKFGVPAAYTDLTTMLARADFDLLVNLTRIPEHGPVSLAVAPEHRARKLIIRIRDLVQSGAIGKPSLAIVRSSHDGPERHNVPRDSTWH
jgi:predicted dehydrogenase